jgi:glutaredoxin
LGCRRPLRLKVFSGFALSLLLNSRQMSLLREVIVYSRKGCHLCEIVKEKLTKLERRGGFRWREVDVETDDSLRRKFTDEVPVVFIDGHKAFKYRLDEQEFLKKLAG